jgi:3-oxoacyl-[acyl-carrier-protein] synthase II
VRRVVISGIGLIGPTGNGTQVFWQSLLSGRSGIGPISRFDPTPYASQIGGEVRDCSYEEFLDPRKLRTTTHVTQLALGAAELARRDARLPAAWYPPEAIGVVLGTALGGWRDAEQQHGVLLERGARRVNPFITNGSPHHSSAAEVASAVGAAGTQLTFSSGCPASAQAIGHAASLVASEELDACFTGGAESPLIPTVLAGMGRTQELSRRNDDPEHASRPFDISHDGLVLSEGSCILLLEAAERALARGVQPYAEIRGAASSCDAHGMYGVDPTGKSGARAIHHALERSRLTAADVDYVCAHANSAPVFDRKESLVIATAFGECAARLPVSSIKGVVGHPFGASAAFQVAAASLAIQQSIIPPTHNLDTPAPECTLDYVSRHPRPAHIRTALVTSYGYGGINSYIILARTI